MLTLLGYSILIIALLVSTIQATRPDILESNRARTMTMLCQSSPFLFLSACFLTESTSLRLVSDYVGHGLPPSTGSLQFGAAELALFLCGPRSWAS